MGVASDRTTTQMESRLRFMVLVPDSDNSTKNFVATQRLMIARPGTAKVRVLRETRGTRQPIDDPVVTDSPSPNVACNVPAMFRLSPCLSAMDV